MAARPTSASPHTAFCPPHTPFFPAAYHAGASSFGIGLESPPLHEAAFREAEGFSRARTILRARMNAALRPIEALTGAPFGAPSTLAACALITEVLDGLDVRRCAYSGLMLPVLEDPVLARRASEGRYGVSELLLYSSVCGTGLDVLPLPGDAKVADLAAAIADVGALAVRLRKPLSARLFPVPGKRAGEMARFENPYLTDARVMELR